MSNISRAFKLDYPDDVRKIAQFLDSRGYMYIAPWQIAALWAKFSDDQQAGWLMATEDQLERFMVWINE